jgi:hypothetical protein
MKVTATFRAPRINLSKYKKALHDELASAITHAAFEWLGATTAIIPVWSGASLATFLPLATEIGFNVSIAPVPTAPNRVSLGLSHGEGSLNMDADKGTYTFKYSTTLSHLIWNEFNNANVFPDPTLFGKLHEPGPYHFQQKGLNAFRQYAQHVRLPGLGGCITAKVIRVR